jgi:DNA repair photolyase
MKPKHIANIKTSTTSSLNAQTYDSIYPYGFPFTLNPTMGCSFACKFCYSPLALRQNIFSMGRNHFFDEVTIRIDIASSLDKELSRLSYLPQYLKRVQINEHSDYYLSEVFRELKKNNRDVMIEILEVFQKHWQNDNKWMLHILTKSNLILNHISEIKNMKEMIQVEISFSTPHENQLRALELYTPTVKKRLDTIEKLSKEGIFVRVMAMPFYGDVSDLDILKVNTFNAGAHAIKNKALNYYDWNIIKKANFDDLVQYKLAKSFGRNDTVISSTHTIKSGEDYLLKGMPVSISVKMPSAKAWDRESGFNNRTTAITLNKIDMGYAQLNQVDWEYIV